MYSIGQILYVISSTSHTIEPVRITSKQIHEDMAGKTVTHMCTTSEGESYNLESQNESMGGIFETIDEAESHLMKLAADMVRKLAEVAREKASLFVDENVSGSSEDDLLEKADEIQTKDMNAEIITLPDGSQARLKFPSEIK